MAIYKITLYTEKYNFETHKYEIDSQKAFRFEDYDSAQNLIGYVSEGNDDVLIRIEKEAVKDEQ